MNNKDIMYEYENPTMETPECSECGTSYLYIQLLEAEDPDGYNYWIQNCECCLMVDLDKE